MPWTHIGDPVVGGFTVGEVQYPATVLDIWPRQDLEALGLVWVEPEPLTLAEARAARNGEVTARREAAFAAGFSPTAGALAGHTLQCRGEADKINWLTSATAYGAAVAAGQGAVSGATFRTMANVTVQTTFAEGYALIVQGMAAWGEAIMHRSWALKDAIDASEDLAALAAIDIEIGWP